MISRQSAVGNWYSLQEKMLVQPHDAVCAPAITCVLLFTEAWQHWELKNLWFYKTHKNVFVYIASNFFLLSIEDDTCIFLNALLHLSKWYFEAFNRLAKVHSRFSNISPKKK